MGAKYTDAQKKATNKYLKTLSSLSVRLPKNEYERFKNAAIAADISLREYVITAINEKINRDFPAGIPGNDKEK